MLHQEWRFPLAGNGRLYLYTVYRFVCLAYPWNGISHELCVFSSAVENTERNSVSLPLDLMNDSLHRRNNSYTEAMSPHRGLNNIICFIAK